MKRLMLLVMVVCILLTSVCPVYAEYEISKHTMTHIVYMEGQIESGESGFVTILVRDSENNIAYIGQYTADAYGKYSAKFEMESNSNDFTYSVKEGTSAVDASVDVAQVSSLPMIIDLEAVNDTNGGKHITESSIASAVANIKNKYSASDSFKFLVSFYDANGILIDCKISDMFEVGFDEVEVTKTFKCGQIPENTDVVRVFAWSDTTTLVPKALDDKTHLNNTIFGDDNEEVVVAFIGDSITHQGQYQKFIESYYKTKYPDREIVFVNKGINGDIGQRVINRFNTDVMNDDFTDAPDEISLMVGMNDIERGFYSNVVGDALKQAKIDKCLENIEKIINLCKDNNISLTLVTPSLYDEGDYTGADTNIATGANAALGKVGEGVKALATQYELPVIDLHTATNYWTNTIRANSQWAQDAVLIPSDRVHPDIFGGFIMGYEYAKQQGNSAVVASVEIDAEKGEAKSENAVLTNLSVTGNNVSYTYKAKSLPMAYTPEYQKAEAYGIPVSDDINNEIIKVSGLAEGNYTITMNGTALTDTYTAQELADGVNIATDTNNPGQITAKAVNEKTEEKVQTESYYRIIPAMEIIAQSNNFEMTDEAAVNAWLEASSESEKSFNEWTLSQYRIYKPKQQETWKKIETLDAEAKALAQTSEIEVMITQQ